MKPKRLKIASIIHTLMSICAVLQPNSPKETQSQEIHNGQGKAYHAWTAIWSSFDQNLADDPILKGLNFPS